MKKTLITLLALCGAASATDSTLVWDLSFNDLNQTVVTNGSGNDYSSLTITMNGSTVTDGICATPANNRVTITDSAATLLRGCTGIGIVLKDNQIRQAVFLCFQNQADKGQSQTRISLGLLGARRLLRDDGMRHRGHERWHRHRWRHRSGCYGVVICASA